MTIRLSDFVVPVAAIAAATTGASLEYAQAATYAGSYDDPNFVETDGHIDFPDTTLGELKYRYHHSKYAGNRAIMLAVIKSIERHGPHSDDSHFKMTFSM